MRIIKKSIIWDQIKDGLSYERLGKENNVVMHRSLESHIIWFYIFTWINIMCSVTIYVKIFIIIWNIMAVNTQINSCSTSDTLDKRAI